MSELKFESNCYHESKDPFKGVLCSSLSDSSLNTKFADRIEGSIPRTPDFFVIFKTAPFSRQQHRC